MQKLRTIDRLLIIGGEGNHPPQLSRRRQALEYLVIALLVAGLGYVDYLTGLEAVVFSFYLLPIRLASVRLGLASGIVISMWATLCWCLSDYYAGQSYSNELIAMWNLMVRLAAFLVVAWLSARNVALFAQERAASAGLQKALSEIKLLEGMLPICAGCKKIRDEKGQWNLLEHYIQQHTAATFTHGMCPDCARQWAREAGLDNK